MLENNTRRTIAGDIYRTIYDHENISRKQIGSILNLSLPTVTNNLQELIDRNLIRIDGTQESTGGRKAATYKCVGEAGYAVGLDITRHHFTVVLIDLLENIIERRRFRRVFEDSDDYIAYTAEMIDSIISDNSISRKLVLGVGISVPAIIAEDQKTITYAKVINISENIYEKIGKYFRYPYYLYNDANSAGLAEWWKNRSSSTAVYLSLNPSIGGATIQNKSIYHGNNNRASEFGHITIVPGGRRCYCGRKGCVDAYCSEMVLSNFTDGNLEKFFEELDTNTGFQRIMDSYLYRLALVTNTLRVCYDCDVIIGGNVGAHLDNYIDTLKEKTMKLNPFESKADYIRSCQYKTAASAVGAALNFVQKFIIEM